MCFVFFFNDTATTEIYTLSLHDALPISAIVAHQNTQREEYGEEKSLWHVLLLLSATAVVLMLHSSWILWERSEEHTSELQSQSNLVCRLLLEKKKIEMTEHGLVLTPSTR